MYKEELLNALKKQGKGLIVTERDYKLFLEASKKEAEEEKRPYDYSVVNSIVYDGRKELKITYCDMPSDSEDPRNRYTNFKYLIITVDQINDLTFVK